MSGAMAPSRVPATIGLIALIMLDSQAAWAFDEELQLGLDTAYAVELGAEGERSHGGSLRGRFRYGLTDAFAIAAIIGWAGHAAPSNNDTHVMRNVFTVAVGVVYALDVMRVVPYAGVHVGAAFSSQEVHEAAFLVDIAGGVDLSVTQSFSVGLEVAYQLLVTGEDIPSRLLVSLRFNWHYHPD